MTEPLRAISLGAGVQSSALLLLALEGRVAADCAIFADTQSEPAAVYANLEMLAERCAAVGFPLHVVTAGDLGADVGGRPVVARIPAFLDGGMMPRQCTRDYKIRPVRRQLRALVGPRGRAVSLLGISLDEVARMRVSDVAWLTNEYPLVDLRWSRWDCQRYLAEHDIVAPKSACVFCPFHSDAGWRALTAAEYEAAAEVEDRMQAAVNEGRQVSIRSTPFLHASRVPLRQVDLTTAEDHGQLTFLGECEGVCGV